MQSDRRWESLPGESETLDEDRAWALLRAVRGRRRAGVDTNSEHLELEQPAPPAVARLFELYLPICQGAAERGYVFAHIGQSLDGQIATSTGASQYVTGPENIVHLHRLRALADAVLVGAGTVERDDPQMTTRLVPGDNPVRVVIDPTLRLSDRHRLFRDAAVATIVVCGARAARGRERLGLAELLPLEEDGGSQLPPQAVARALARRGLRDLFIEGGGVTVSRFLRARALDRLHLTISPVFLGQGRPGIVLPAIKELTAALRPEVRRFTLGDDVLFDCRLGA